MPSSVVSKAAKYAEAVGAADDGEEGAEEIKMEVLVVLPEVDSIVDSSAANSCAGFFW